MPHIGKQHVAKINQARVKLCALASGDELAVCVFSGAQRDDYVAQLVEVKRLCGPLIGSQDDDSPPLSQSQRAERFASQLSGEHARAMVGMQYELIRIGVMDAEAFVERGVIEPLFESVDAVAAALPADVIREWAAVVEEVNGIGATAEKKTAVDFFGSPSGERGSD